MSNELVLEHSIIEMHTDLDPWAVLSVGFNNDKNLVFVLTFDDLDDQRDSWKKSVIIDQKGIDILAHRLGTRLTQLPDVISRRFGYEGESWRVSEVFDTYNAILVYLGTLKIHYQIKKEVCRK